MSNKISIGFYNIIRHTLQKSAKPFLTLRIHIFLSTIISLYNIRLVMKQTDSCKCHNHIVLVCTLDDKIITYRTTRLCDILHTTLLCTLYIIREWEECIRTKCYISISIVRPESCPHEPVHGSKHGRCRTFSDKNGVFRKSYNGCKHVWKTWEFSAALISLPFLP